MFNDILLPTDGSAGMEQVIEYATELATEHDAAVHVLYVIDTATISRMPMESSWEAISEMLREEGERALENAETLLDDVPVERALIEGSPSTAIVEYADDNDCDLIVMGTHGRGGIDRLLLGSVAERVVRTSPVPVMTVRVQEELSE